MYETSFGTYKKNKKIKKIKIEQNHAVSILRQRRRLKKKKSSRTKQNCTYRKKINQ